MAKTEKVNPKTWRFRRTALGIDKVLAIETKSWTNNRWQPLDANTVLRLPNDALGIEIKGKIYSSIQRVWHDGRLAYGIVD